MPVSVVESGAAKLSAPPDWMKARPDTVLRIVRGGSAYAVVPMAASATLCTQRLEVLAPDGGSCGGRDYPIADGTCITQPPTVAADGTVIQQLPTSMETYVQNNGNSCTWRWWGGRAALTSDSSTRAGERGRRHR